MAHCDADLKEGGDHLINLGWVEAHGCVAAFEVVADRPGAGTVTASFAQSRTGPHAFRFYLPLGVPVFATVAAGGLLGGFAQAATIWRRSRYWRPARWCVTLTAGVVSGLAVFLVYHFGVLETVPGLSGGLGLVLLLSLVGGFLGPNAIQRIADQLLPSGENKAG